MSSKVQCMCGSMMKVLLYLDGFVDFKCINMHCQKVKRFSELGKEKKDNLIRCFCGDLAVLSGDLEWWQCSKRGSVCAFRTQRIETNKPPESEVEEVTLYKTEEGCYTKYLTFDQLAKLFKEKEERISAKKVEAVKIKNKKFAFLKVDSIFDLLKDEK
jgi:hypothetical protein